VSFSFVPTRPKAFKGESLDCKDDVPLGYWFLGNHTEFGMKRLAGPSSWRVRETKWLRESPGPFSAQPPDLRSKASAWA
jgi:hypothetical protein